LEKIKEIGGVYKKVHGMQSLSPSLFDQIYNYSKVTTYRKVYKLLFLRRFMVRKTYFKERTVPQIRDLSTQRVYSQRDLVKKITDLDPANEGLVIASRLIPNEFYQGGVNSRVASRRNLKKGNYVHLSQPQNLTEAINDPRIPLQYRKESILKEFAGKEEGDIHSVGFSFRPFMGNDRRRRYVPFHIGPEGARISAYSEFVKSLPGVVGKNAGTEVVSYTDSNRVAREGGKVVVRIPSREKTRKKYEMQFTNLPLVETTDKNHNPRAIILGLNTRYVVSPKEGFWRFGYTDGEDSELSDKKIFLPQDVAAYLAVVEKELRENHNWVPMVVNPFALPSLKQIEFYKKLRNNLLIHDPIEEDKLRLRKLHLDEVSMLLARQVAVEGHDETLFWDWDRDGKLKDYDWIVGGGK